MNAIQIVVANRGSARFYECAAPAAALAPVEELSNPGLGIHERDLVSSRSGRKRNAGPGGPQAMSPRTPARTHAIETFARTIARRIGAQAEARDQGELILVAEPRLLGSIRAKLSKASRARLAASVPLDLVHDSAPALRRRLAPVVRRIVMEVEPRP